MTGGLALCLCMSQDLAGSAEVKQWPLLQAIISLGLQTKIYPCYSTEDRKDGAQGVN